MQKNIKRIKSILDQANKNNSIIIDQISTIIIQTRQIIEFDKSQEKYKFLNLYCNWILHTKLQNSITVYRILEDMNRTIFHDSNRNDTNYIIERVSTLLSLKNLKKDFIDLYDSKKLPIFLFNNQENWKTFISILLLEISDKPLEFPDKIKEKSSSKGFKKPYKAYSELRNSSTVSFFSSANTPPLEAAFVQGLTIIQDDEKKCFQIRLSLLDKERTGGVYITIPLSNRGI